MSTLNLIKQVLGLFSTASQNHHWDGSVANQLSLKRGTPASPGAKVIDIVDGKVEFPSGRTYASGEVIQEKLIVGSGNTVISSTAWGQLNDTLTFTPKSTNSKIITEITGYAYPGSYAGGISYINLYIDVDNVNASGTCSLGVLTTGDQVVTAASIRAIVTNAALTDRTIKLFGAKSTSSAGSGNFNNLQITIREVQN